MVSLPQPCRQCSAPVHNYSGWCAKCGYKPETSPDSTGLVERWTKRLRGFVLTRVDQKDFGRPRENGDIVVSASGAEKIAEFIAGDVADALAAKEAENGELRTENDRYAAIMGQKITRDARFDGVTILAGCTVSTLIVAATRSPTASSVCARTETAGGEDRLGAYVAKRD